MIFGAFFSRLSILPRATSLVRRSALRRRLQALSLLSMVAILRSIEQQHELASRVALLAGPVRLPDLGQRERLRDGKGEPSRLDQLAELVEDVERPAGVAAAEPDAML